MPVGCTDRIISGYSRMVDGEPINDILAHETIYTSAYQKIILLMPKYISHKATLIVTGACAHRRQLYY